MVRYAPLVLFAALLFTGCPADSGTLDPVDGDAVNWGVVFNASEVVDIHLTVDPTVLAVMDNETYVTGSFRCQDETIDLVGIRYKGNSSYMSPGLKKSYKVDFNIFMPGQTWQGAKKFNANNNFKDPSCMRERLAYDLFRAMGVPASRTSHVNVYMNNALMGVYTNVQQVDKIFLAEWFDDNGGNLFKAIGFNCDLSYLGADEALYKADYELKTNEFEDDYSGLVHFIDVVTNTSDPLFAVEIEKVFEVDPFLSWLVVNTVLSNLDSYSGSGHNFYLYENPTTGRFAFIPWDLNEAFGNFTAGWSADEMLTLDIYAPYGRANPPPALRAVCGFGTGDAWASGAFRTILRLDTGTWTGVGPRMGPPANFNGVHGTSSNDLWAVGDMGEIQHWAGGSLLYSGTPTSAGTPITITDTAGFGTAGVGDVVIITSAGGPASGERSTIVNVNASTIECQPPFTAAPQPGQTYDILDDWNKVNAGTTVPLFAVFAADAANVFAVGASGRVVHFNGTQWRPMTSGPGPPLRSVWGSAPNNMYAVGDGPTILHFPGFGPLLVGDTPDGVCQANTIQNSSGFGTAQRGDMVIITADGGSGPSPGEKATIIQVQPTVATFMPPLSAAPQAGSTVYDIVHGWNPMTCPATSHLFGVHGTTASDIHAVGAAGTALYFDGGSWSAVSVPVTQDLRGVFAISASAAFAVGNSGTILFWNGSSWSVETSPTTVDLAGVWAFSATDAFAVGAEGTILHRDATGWSVMDSGLPPPTDPTRVLIERILAVTEFRTAYEGKMTDFLDGAFTSTAMDGAIDGLYSLIQTHVYADTLKPYTNTEFEDSIVTDIPPTGPNRILGLKPFVTQRRSSVLGQLP